MASELLLMTTIVAVDFADAVLQNAATSAAGRHRVLLLMTAVVAVDFADAVL